MEDVPAILSEDVLALGPSSFLRDVVVPFSSEIEALARLQPASTTDAPKLEVHANPRAGILTLSGLVGAVAFVGGWGAKKALDELYEQKLRPILGRAVHASFGSPYATGKMYGVSLLITKVPERISILVAAVGTSVEEVSLSEKQIKPVATVAIERARQFAAAGEVHLYIIENGGSNTHPWVYRDLSAALQHLNGMTPVKAPKLLPNGS